MKKHAQRHALAYITRLKTTNYEIKGYYEYGPLRNSMTITDNMI